MTKRHVTVAKGAVGTIAKGQKYRVDSLPGVNSSIGFQRKKTRHWKPDAPFIFVHAFDQLSSMERTLRLPNGCGSFDAAVHVERDGRLLPCCNNELWPCKRLSPMRSRWLFALHPAMGRSSARIFFGSSGCNIPYAPQHPQRGVRRCGRPWLFERSFDVGCLPMGAGRGVVAQRCVDGKSRSSHTLLGLASVHRRRP